MISYQSKVSDLLKGLIDTASVKNVADFIVHGLSLDTRQMRSGDAFIAVAGTQAHGLDFLEAALAKSPSVILFEPTEKYSNCDGVDIPVIAIPDLAKHVSLIASRFYGNPAEFLNITAITGTNGKTSCAYLLAQLLTLMGTDAAMIGTIGSGRINDLRAAELTTPDAICLQARLAEFKDIGITHVVMEASSHALHQHRMDAVAVDIAAFTNLTQDHLDYHLDMSEYLNAKALLFSFESLSHVILNADDQGSQSLLAVVSEDVEKITYSCNDGSSDVVASAIHADAVSTRFNLIVKGSQKADSTLNVTTRLIGQFNVSNILLVISVMHALGYKTESLLDAIQKLEAPKGRMQRLGSDDTPTVVIDYAHTPDALEKALSTLKQLVIQDLAAVFGCGGDRDRSKRAIMGSVAEGLANRIYLTDDNPRTENSTQIISDIQTGIKSQNKIKIIPDRADAIRVSIELASAQDIVLIAGKGHEDYQIVGNEKIPFSDQQHAHAALQKWEESRA